MLMPEGSPAAAMLVRRADGQFALQRVDSRVASAARAAARWLRRDAAPGVAAAQAVEATPSGPVLVGTECFE